jgi:hypothetical protein
MTYNIDFLDEDLDLLNDDSYDLDREFLLESDTSSSTANLDSILD